jgi:hypothetical protein
MAPSSPTYISASRRTDIPRFRCNEFFDAWKRGEITYDGGYGRSYTVSLKPEHVLGYIFWSKDFRPLIEHPLFPELLGRNNALFHFTINDCPDLEPNVAPLRERTDTLKRLCALVGPERVLWRYDPVVRYRLPGRMVTSNEGPFFRLLPTVASAGVRHCYFSFATMYNKLRGRPVLFFKFPEEEKKRIAGAMLEAATEAGMALYNCCNAEVLELVPGVKMAHCIDEAILRETDRFGVYRPLEIRPTREGCGCYESRDIGSYGPPCPHGCLYCYANPEKAGNDGNARLRGGRR